MDDESYNEWLDSYKDHGMSYEDWLENRGFTSGGDSGIIKSIDVDDYKAMTHGKNIAEEVNNVILDTMRQCERENGFVISEIWPASISATAFGTPVMQIEPLSNGLLQLNLNTDILSGKTVNEIDQLFARSDATVVNSLKEAVIHESGHAILISGKTVPEIRRIYNELGKVHIDGISETGNGDGVECLAELEVLRYRGAAVSEEAMKFYETYMGRKY